MLYTLKSLIPAVLLSSAVCCSQPAAQKIAAPSQDAAPAAPKLIRHIAASDGKPGGSATFTVTLSEGAAPDSMVVEIDGERIGRFTGTAFTWRIPATQPLGMKKLRVTAYAAGTHSATTATVGVHAARKPQLYGYKVLKTYPHSTSAYTQGLFWHDGAIWEGTGLNGRSALRKVDLQTGRTLAEQTLDKKFFGEGIALVGERVYQLTWREGRCMVYDAATLAPSGEFGYQGEGWGLTSDGEVLYMSDGSQTIRVVDPATFGVARTIQVTTDEGVIDNINELEWIGGEIWANVYTTDSILRIDPATGEVRGIIDMGGLLQRGDYTPQTDVLNGIAYDKASGRIFVTGKNWPKLFQIEVTKR